MNEAVSVSVVIPCYNCKATIDRAIQSVEKQTFKPKEIILVDDYENKKDSDFLVDLSKIYDIKIVLIRNSHNKGAAYSRNKGWDVASSDFVAFLDSDDAWHPQKIEIQYKYMVENSSVFISGHDIDFKVNKQCFDNNIQVINISAISLLFRNSLPTPTLMIRNHLKIYRFNPKMRYVDDHLLLLHIVLDKRKITKIKKPLAIVFKPMFGESGLSSNMWKMQLHEWIAYREIFLTKKINLFSYIFLTFFSGVKFIRRIVVFVSRKIIKRSKK